MSDRTMGIPHYKWSQKLVTSPELNDYRIKLTPDWARSLDDTAAPSPVLNGIVSDFLMAMRTVEVASSMPFTLVTSFNHFVTGYTRDDKRDSVAKKTALLITSRLTNELAIRDPELRHRIALKCLEIGGKVHAVNPQTAPPAFSLEDIWLQYNQEKGFRLALWESQRLGVVSAYNTYDILLIRCLKQAYKWQRFRRGSDEHFARLIVDAFGQNACDVCWSDSTLQLYREVRHTITHTGGRVTDKLIMMGHPFEVLDDVIQIMPDHLMQLLRIIERAADCLVAAALENPAFKARSTTNNKSVLE